MLVIELSGDQAAAIPPVEQAVAATLGHTVELSREAADLGEFHRVMFARPTPARHDRGATRRGL